MKTYTCAYKFNGKHYVVHIEAEDFADASRRLRAIGMTAQVDGELIAEGNLYPLNWINKLVRIILGDAKRSST